MGIERMHSPAYWQKRAKQFQLKADNVEEGRTKETLRKVAERYNDLARQAERIGAAKEAAE